LARRRPTVAQDDAIDDGLASDRQVPTAASGGQIGQRRAHAHTVSRVARCRPDPESVGPIVVLDVRNIDRHRRVDEGKLDRI
jgi:hypothetical protein